MSEDTNGSFWLGSQKVRRREEDPSDSRRGSEQTEPMGSKPFSFRDAVMNSNPLNNPLNNKWEDDNIDLMDRNIIKIDLMTDKGARGQFARFAVQIDLRKLFISKIKIASRIHRVEYESLPLVFFGRGTFRHLKRDYPQPKIMENMEKRLGEAEDPIRLDKHENTGSIQERIENEKFGEWMFVDHRNCRQNWRTDNGQESGKGNNLSRPRFNILSKIGVSKDDNNENGDRENIDGLVGMVPVRQTIQGMVDHLEVEEVVHRGESDATLIDDSSD
ncbi:hypothetical protein Goari_006023, partial [Gossypium aridum]|nr:hypothetical protein [Gossypium aridum]